MRAVKARKLKELAYSGLDYRKRDYKQLPTGQIVANYDRKFYKWLKRNGTDG